MYKFAYRALNIMTKTVSTSFNEKLMKKSII